MRDIHPRVAYLGPPGTHSHAALLKYFGTDDNSLPVAELPEVFARVEDGSCDFGVVPVENSTEGSVTVTLDCFGQSHLVICGEVMLRIHHHLALGADSDPDMPSRIVSHQQSLAQCRRWLNDHFPGVETVSVSSNAEAARIAAEQRGVAAITTSAAAERYGLRIMAREIEDSHDNTTRFLVVRGSGTSPATGNDKTSIIIATNNRPGALFQALEPFHRHGVNLIRLESRPSRQATWAYSFYVDLEGHVQDPNVSLALQALERHALGVKLLGSYPAAVASE